MDAKLIHKVRGVVGRWVVVVGRGWRGELRGGGGEENGEGMVGCGGEGRG